MAKKTISSRKIFKEHLCRGMITLLGDPKDDPVFFGDEYSSTLFGDDFDRNSSLTDEELIAKAKANRYEGIASGKVFQILMEGRYYHYEGADVIFLNEETLIAEQKEEYERNHTPEEEAILAEEYDNDLNAYATALVQGDLFENLDYGVAYDYYHCIIKMVYHLCDILAFWSNGDRDQMNRIFCSSKLHKRLNGAWESNYPDTKISIRELILRRACLHMKNHYTKPSKISETGKDQNAIFIEVGGIAHALAEFHPENKSAYRWNDSGMAELFSHIYKEDLLYCQDRKSWFIFDGRKWGPDNMKAKLLCDRFVNALHDYADCFPNLSERIGSRTIYYSDFVRRYETRRGRDNILADASAYNAVSSSEFDANDTKYLFNCINGTYDMRENRFLPHNPEHKLTMLSNVWYDRDARCERWEQHIYEIFNGALPKNEKKKREILETQTEEQKALPRYLQECLAYSLTGNTSLECGFILYGPTGRNGKSLTVDTILRMMGDYGITTSPDTITQARVTNAGGPSEHIARLNGKRFVSIAEPDIGMVLSEALVKNLTGNDKIVARNLREGSMEFYPQFKIFINTNHKPEARDTTVFSRLHMIPFNYTFEGENLDPTLKDKFAKRENLSGIFNWCLDGLPELDVLMNMKKWELHKSAVLEEANIKFRQEINTVELFLSSDNDEKGAKIRENIVEITGSEDDAIPRKALYERYIRWCKETSNIGYGRKMFNQIMESIPRITYTRKRLDGEKNAQHCFAGLKWTDEELEKQTKKKTPEELEERKKEKEAQKRSINLAEELINKIGQLASTFTDNKEQPEEPENSQDTIPDASGDTDSPENDGNKTETPGTNKSELPEESGNSEEPVSGGTSGTDTHPDNKKEVSDKETEGSDTDSDSKEDGSQDPEPQENA